MSWFVFVIAGVFFLVTMGLAVGPLLLCRLFAGPRENCQTKPGPPPFVQGFLGLCGLVVALGVAVVATYLMRGTSTQQAVTTNEIAPTEVGSTEATEHTLFDEPASQPQPASAVFASDRPTLLMLVLLPLLLVTSLAALGSEWFRRNLARALPVLLACGLLAILIARTSHHHQSPATVWHADSAPQNVVTMREAPVPPTPAVSTPPRAAKPVAVPEAAPLDDDTHASADSSQATTQTVKPGEDTPAIITYVGTASAGVPRSRLPLWTSETDEGPIRVIDSGKHATVQLAEEEALKELTSLLQTEFVRRYPQAAGWQPPPNLLLHTGNILQRAVERSQITVGDFTSPMYQAYWQVNANDVDALYDAWQPSIVKQRLAWLGGGVALLTLLLGSLAGVLRVDEQTGGQRRKALAAGTLALWAAVGAIAIFVA